MNFSAFFRRATSSLKFWSVGDPVRNPVQESAALDTFQVDAMAQRVDQMEAPQPQEPVRAHVLFKLAPIPLPRAVRLESQVLYLGAWAGTAALAWGGFQVPSQWLLWYGAAAIGLFALLFRLEGPRTRAERRAREAEVARCHAEYVAAEAHLREVLSERFNERKEEFHAMRRLYDEACQAIESVESTQATQMLARLTPMAHGEAPAEVQLAQQVDLLEQRMMELVDELEDFSDIHKEAIDAAIMARHNARLAYWQAKLDEAVLTGEAVQQH